MNRRQAQHREAYVLSEDGVLQENGEVEISYYNTKPIWLSSAYVSVGPEPLYEISGPQWETENTEALARMEIENPGKGRSKLFLSGDKLFAYLVQAYKRGGCDGIVSFVIPGLVGIYSRNHNKLSEEEKRNMLVALDYPQPRFKNTSEYESIKDTIKSPEIQQLLPFYQLFGEVSQYIVLHAPVPYVVRHMNHGVPLDFILDKTREVIRLEYKNTDFQDAITGETLMKIPTGGICGY